MSDVQSVVLNVDESTISKYLKAMGIIQNQGNWVPHKLRERDDCERFNYELLFQKQKRKSSLHRIVIGDEKWIRYDNPKRKKL